MADTNDIMQALQQEFATTVNKIYIHSLDREVGFREVRVAEQKTITKILVENEGKEDVIYASMLALIKTLCLEADTIDFDKLTELDRIKIMIELYQNNFFQSNMTYECNECQTENEFELNFEKIVENLNQLKFDDITINIDDKHRNYTFVINFPTTKRMADFLKATAQSKRLTATAKMMRIDNTDIFDLFIKKFTVENKAEDGKVITVECEQLRIRELEEILQVLPQTILYSADGVLGRIQEELFNKVDSLFDKPICSNCGAKQKETVGLTDFFM
jgi:uncharacterized protein YqkB